MRAPQASVCSGEKPTPLDVTQDLEIRPSFSTPGVAGLYLDLMKRVLLDAVYENDLEARQRQKIGLGWPGRAHTMIGMQRLDNLHQLADEVIKKNISGDFMEAGAWRGGATILMRAILEAYGIADRAVWVADSFEGLPAPDDEKFPMDKGSEYHLDDSLAVSLGQVQVHFNRYGLLDAKVKFLKGFFKDTLPSAPIKQLALLRIDVDMYQSTMEALEYLYPKLSAGGYVIIDDYDLIPACRQAVDDYRAKNGITADIQPIDKITVYWQKP